MTASWIHFKGFENHQQSQVTQTGHTQSECFENHGSNNIYEQLKMHDGMAIGYYALASSNNLVLNCDAWNNWDSVSKGGKGGNTDGFGCHVAKGGTGNVFRYCRAWYNSDDGYDCINCARPCCSITAGRCTTASRPTTAAPATATASRPGATASPQPRPQPHPRNTVQFCLAVGNKAAGFYANHHTGGADWLNNTAIGNANNYNMLEISLANNADVPGPNAFMRNNLGYKGGREFINLDVARSDITNNYFTLGPGGGALAITDADFLSLDEKQLVGPRKADGSLPEVTFMHLAPGSKLIDKGVEIKNAKGEVRFAYEGAKPDLGCFEAPGDTAETLNIRPSSSPPLSIRARGQNRADCAIATSHGGPMPLRRSSGRRSQCAISSRRGVGIPRQPQRRNPALSILSRRANDV